MVSGAPDVTYTITVDATFVMAVVIYHVLLVVLHIMLRPGKVRAPTPPTTLPEPKDPPSAPTETDVVTCRAPPVFFARREGECYHTDVHCRKLRCAKSIMQLRPCSDCISCCTFHKTK